MIFFFIIEKGDPLENAKKSRLRDREKSSAPEYLHEYSTAKF